MNSSEGTTLPETNIGTENPWLEDEISFWDGLFPGAMLVSGRVSIFIRSAVDHGLSAERPNGGVMPTHRIARLDPPIPQGLEVGGEFFGPGGLGGVIRP